MRALVRRRALTIWNTVSRRDGGHWLRDVGFGAAGVLLLFGLHHGFLRLLQYMAKIDLIGFLLIWKLAALLFMMTLSMTAVSGLLTSLTTLFYAQDLRFLMRAPLHASTVFLDKALESAFFASWMIALVLAPFALALSQVLAAGPAFLAAFALALPPFLMLAAALGIAVTLVLLWAFPSSRTRDIVWALSSLSMTVMYGLLRLAEPERLMRPDMMRAATEYLRFLQAPTAPYLPSAWLTRAVQAAAERRWLDWAGGAGFLWLAAFLVYAGLTRVARVAYFPAFSGAQEQPLRRRTHLFQPLTEASLLGRVGGALVWKERVGFFRDVKHWSQIVLIVGLVFVYLFSIRRLPLESPDLRSLISFLNVGTAGFVLAALGLRFTFPSISLEGRSWWVLRAAPITIPRVMRNKLAFSALPALMTALVLGMATNWILGADRFTAVATLGALLSVALVLSVMGIGFGALFPRFRVENVHQIESSLGGFVYMAASLFYIAATVAFLAIPMQMHFHERFGRAAWDWRIAAAAGGTWLALSAAACTVPWIMGERALEVHEAD